MTEEKIACLKNLIKDMADTINRKNELIEKMGDISPEKYEDYLHEIIDFTIDICLDNGRLHQEAMRQLKELRRNRPPTILDRIINMAKKWNMWRGTNGK